MLPGREGNKGKHLSVYDLLALIEQLKMAAADPPVRPVRGLLEETDCTRKCCCFIACCVATSKITSVYSAPEWWRELGVAT